MPTCPASVAAPKKCIPPNLGKADLSQLLEPNFPDRCMKWERNGTNQPQPRGVYTWISAPRAIYNNRKLIRNGGESQQASYQNLMHDRRIVRGSNFTSSGVQAGDGDNIYKEVEARRRQILRKKHVARNQRGIIGTPPAVRGRKHENVQTEKYLEELFVRPQEMDAGCQTDLFLHRPPSPAYVPQKVGRDVATEILEGELFDFDTEVVPIVEVLVGRTIEQALIEVLHEEEIAEMKRQQQQIMAIREAELAELRRLELEDRKLQTEREHRILQDKIAQDLDKEMQERITASKLLRGRIDDLLPDVVNAVENIKDEKDLVEFEKQIAPWLAKEVAQEIGQMIDSKELLEDIIREVLIQKKTKLFGETIQNNMNGTQDEVRSVNNSQDNALEVDPSTEYDEGVPEEQEL
ncbi:radial spoke head protein 3 homolog B [Toxorhynchites rutilus septentrionalis]|uniref:radial spoke head protein 3 homolog B n=1 Tax=Toxorhynchites rutilus septentrionalis TaxID=329112 RepID=UPI0024789D4D|nr:radial spoke head protein 3 homolog B [Toxorhynchites rutilus septentrionalis]